jgi:hypothetical protein
MRDAASTEYGRPGLGMATLDIWSNAASWRLQGLIQSAFACLLAAREIPRPIYLCSPWISDFVVFENGLAQFSALVPSAADKMRLFLSDCLAQLAEYQEIRIFSKKTDSTEAFARIPALRRDGIRIVFGDDRLHEKGILTPYFYLEGSMNITYSGVTLNSEKIVYHSGTEPEIRSKLANTYLEFDRRWKLLQN